MSKAGIFKRLSEKSMEWWNNCVAIASGIVVIPMVLAIFGVLPPAVFVALSGPAVLCWLLGNYTENALSETRGFP